MLFPPLPRLFSAYKQLNIDALWVAPSFRYEELSAISERIGDVSRGVPTATMEQNTFTFDYETPAPDSEIAVQAASDPTLARCSVCLCDLEQGECCRRLPCLHMFHKGCIDDWLKRNRACPVCKTDIVTGASETRKESGEAQCSAASMPGEPDFQPPGWGEEELGAAAGMPGGFGLGPPRQVHMYLFVFSLFVLHITCSHVC